MMPNEKKLRRAIVPGSFDPMTVGHEDILKRASKLYDEVYLALLINPSKKYLFDLETRILIAECAAKDIPNAKVVHSDGMLADLARELGCEAIIKGARNEKDFTYEMKMALYNRALAPEIETFLLPCDDKLGEISSTLVRSLLEKGEYEKANALLPKGALDIILKRGYK
ncbi:MAG: pantetheine-phosphate adenylyltransferase [Clostridia bacterium]|nr:pantetheine-phosphate adenylyltransferase [Clostridia bacterium]